jgi:hypothetical protein
MQTLSRKKKPKPERCCARCERRHWLTDRGGRLLCLSCREALRRPPVVDQRNNDCFRPADDR